MSSEEIMFQTARAAFENGERDRARDLLTRLIKANPNNAEYWLLMSAVVYTVKERIFCLKEAYRLDPNNDLVQRGLVMSGVLPVDPKKAIPLREQATNWQEEQKNQPLTLANRLMMAPLWLQAAVLLAVVILAGAGLYLGISRLSRGLSAALHRPPTPTYAALEVYATSTLDYSRPTPTFDGPTPLWAALERTYTPTPRYVDTPHPRTEDYRTAMSAYARGDWASALTYLQNALLLEPEAADLLFYIGEVQRFMNQYDSALEAYEEAIALAPEFAPAYLGRALARLGQNPNNTVSARNDLLEAIRLDPLYADAFRELASLEISQGNGEAALSYLEKALELQPDSPLSLHLRGRADLLIGNLDQALEDALLANQLDITLIPNYRLLGEIYIQKQRYSEAIGPLQTYLLYQPEDEQAWVWLGEVYQAVEQSSLAMNVYTQYLQNNPNSTVILAGRGSLYLRQNQPQLARADFERILQLEPRSFEANMGLGQSLMLLEEYGAAYMKFAYCEGLFETQQQQAQVFYWRAQSLEALGENRAALRDWQALLAMPDDVMPAEYKTLARQRIAALTTPTFTIQPSLTPTATHTRWPTLTLKPSSTRQASPTITPSRSVTPTRTPTP